MGLPITFDEAHKAFTIQTRNSTYQFMVDTYGTLLHLYYGRKTAGCMDFLLTCQDRGFSGNIYDAGENRAYSYDALPMEFPVFGNGDLRAPALSIQNHDGSLACDLRYAGYEIREGKYALPGLPAVYVDQEQEAAMQEAAQEDQQAATLEVTLKDQASGALCRLLYGVLPELDIITRSVRIENTGSASFTLKKLLPCSIDFLPGAYDVLSFYGRHGYERKLQCTSVRHGAFSIGSRRGTSSHQYNPLLILAEKETNEDYGSCWAAEFVWSGEFSALCEKDQFDSIRFQMGLAGEDFSYPLQPGESLYAPEVILSFSRAGLSGLSRNLHETVRRHVCRGYWRDRVRPVLLNSWEAFYFDFSGKDMIALGEQAKSVGVDLLVMDDGWFGERSDDFRGLGDWNVNEEKLGGTLSAMVEEINRMGLMFGIWVEPEMVNENSRLYREHPDWALKIQGRDPVRARNQLVLDFSRKEVRDHIFAQITTMLDSANIEYVKWDYNRSIVDVPSRDGKGRGAMLYDYMLGVYEFLERLVQRYPKLLIEGCSGGGGRFDAGMLYYTPQIWCSDNTDAVDRLVIQHGTSFGYPLSSMGAHVSVVPNEQNGRVTPLDMRFAVAATGGFGYELDRGKVSEEEKAVIRQQIEEFKQMAAFVVEGDYYRLTDPGEEEHAVSCITAKDGSEALLTAITLDNHCNNPVFYAKARGLTSGAMYENEEDGKQYPADALMEIGFPVPQSNQLVYRTYRWHLIRR